MRSLQDAPRQWSSNDRRHIQLPSLELSLPSRPKPNNQSLDSPRFVDAPLSSAISPRNNSFSQISMSRDYRSPVEPPMSAIEFDRSPFSRRKLMRKDSGPFTDDLTPIERFETESEFHEETDRLRHIHLDEGRHSRLNSLSYESQAQSLKRRASSPPGDEPIIRHASSQSDLLRRREGVSRHSPAPRLSVNPPLNPPLGSMSSVSSGDRSGSFGGLSTATSMTSSLSFGRRSPVGVSPSGLSPTEVVTSPFATPNSLTLSPRTTVPRTGLHQRGPSDSRNAASPRKLTEPAIRTPSGVARAHGFHMCDCCPKKPKKFETQEELT